MKEPIRVSTAPLAQNHDVDEVVYDAKVVNAGYQGPVAADQLFGGPALASNQGNMTLRDSRGNIVDALNYGGGVDPWLGEGFQGQSGLEEPGNFVRIPSTNQRMLPGQTPAVPDISFGRYPDGADNDENQFDFSAQKSFSLSAPVNPGDVNIKINSVDGIIIGQRLFLGPDAEPVIAANIGTPGYAPLAVAAPAGSTKLSVSGVQGFSVGQTVYVGDEKAEIASVKAARRNMWGPVPAVPVYDEVILAAPLKQSHGTGDALAGTGITVSSPIKGAYAAGASVAGAVPTPGAPNRY